MNKLLILWKELRFSIEYLTYDINCNQSSYFERMIIVKRHLTNKCGSTLILLVIAIAITATLGASLLSITMANYKIKKVNSEAKQSFYYSESGLNKSYLEAYNLVGDAVDDSMEKAEEYLKLYPLNEIEAMNIFKENYKIFVAGEIRNRINDAANPLVQISNVGTLSFILDKLTVIVQSKYISANNIVKISSADLIIQVPDYNGIITGTIDLSNLLSLVNWDIN